MYDAVEKFSAKKFNGIVINLNTKSLVGKLVRDIQPTDINKVFLIRFHCLILFAIITGVYDALTFLFEVGPPN